MSGQKKGKKSLSNFWNYRTQFFIDKKLLVGFDIYVFIILYAISVLWIQIWILWRL